MGNTGLTAGRFFRFSFVVEPNSIRRSALHVPLQAGAADTLRCATLSGMTISVLSSPPEALSREELAAISSSTPSTFEGIAPLTRHHEPNGVTLRLEPAFDGFTGEGLEGALYVTEG